MKRHAMLMGLADAATTEWHVDDTVVLAKLRELDAAPGFEAAMAAMAHNMLRVCSDDAALNATFKDAGRYVAAMCASALQDEGISLSRLRSLCAAFGIVSSGRVYALLQYMRYLGFIQLWATPDSAGHNCYAATPQFLKSWHVHLKAALSAAGRLNPIGTVAAERLNDPDFAARFCAVQMRTLSTFSQQTDTSSPLFSVFLHRNAGSQILWTMLAENGDQCPPTDSFYVSAAAIVRRFGTSRMHVGRLLRDAQAKGLLESDPVGKYRFTETAIAEIRTFYAWQIGLLMVSAVRTDPAIGFASARQSLSPGAVV